MFAPPPPPLSPLLSPSATSRREEQGNEKEEGGRGRGGRYSVPFFFEPGVACVIRPIVPAMPTLSGLAAPEGENRGEGEMEVEREGVEGGVDVW